MKTQNWYKIGGKFVHYEEFCLNGKRLSPLERYDFEKKNFAVLYPKTLLQKIKSLLN